MYSEIWLPERLDSEKWLSSLLSIRLNWKGKEEFHAAWYVDSKNDFMLTLLEAISETERCVCIVSSWSKHQSSSSSVSTAVRIKVSSGRIRKV